MDTITMDVYVDSRGEVSGEAEGVIVEECTGVCQNLGLNREMIMEALEELDEDKDFVDYYLSGYTRTITPVGSFQVLKTKVMPQLVFRDHIENRTRRTRAGYVGSMTRKLGLSGSLTWSSSNSTTKGFKVGWNWVVEGSGSIDWTTTTGRGYTYQDTVEVSACRELRAELEPGDSVLGILTVDRRVFTVGQRYRVDISGTVVGCIGTNRTKSYKLSDVLEAAGLKSTRKFTATAVLDCYIDAKLTLRDYED